MADYIKLEKNGMICYVNVDLIVCFGAPDKDSECIISMPDGTRDETGMSLKDFEYAMRMLGRNVV